MSVGDTDFKCGIVGCNLLMSVSDKRLFQQ